ncbi:MAG TPA: response regulator [Symbiobacteriaceae bacterium]|jgi:response regulator of citrate/malate metabolism
MTERKPFSVLVVEDDFMVASVHRAFVERIPEFAVQAVVHTGREALAALAQQEPDVVLLDIYLPDLSGLQVLWEMRQRRVKSDVIFITAVRDVETVREAMRGGAVRYLAKPFGFAKFSAILNDYARMRHQLGETGPLEQQQIDQVYGASSTEDPENLPKGLSSITLGQVISFLHAASEPVTAEAVAAGIGVTRVTARRYLEHLVRQGLVRCTVRYGTVGRPEHRYAANPRLA